jgi:hypothetical protein
MPDPTAATDPGFVRRIADQADELSEKLVERNARIKQLEAALRIIETEVYGRPEPFCRRIAAEIVGVLGVAPA